MKRLSAAGMLLGIILLFASAMPALGPQYSLFEGSTFRLPAGVNAVDLIDAPAGFSQDLRVVRDEEGPAVDLSPLGAGWYSLMLEPPHQKIEVQLLTHRWGYVAALGALLFLLGLPGVLIPESQLAIEGGGRVSGWLYLMVDQNGLNLPRLLLLIFFLPCAIVFLTLAFALHQFPNLPESVWQLLAFGGAGAGLGAVLDPRRSSTSPAAPPPGAGQPLPSEPPPAGQAYQQIAAAAEALPLSPAPTSTPATIKRPSLTDLFRDPDGYGDISHFQTLVISLSTAVIFLFEFFDDWVIPEIPERVLQLLATSLAVYLGVKSIKIVKQS